MLAVAAATRMQAETAVKRAHRGGLLSGPQLAAVSTLVHGGGRLRTAIAAAMKQAAGDGRPEALAPLAASIKAPPPAASSPPPALPRLSPCHIWVIQHVRVPLSLFDMHPRCGF